ncbi:DUF3168 domain-containing protein [Flexibacterium corallicola]|uniref:DUF3168 domain-containing protein n=1 Tax=Flexibacterium corallicola TaxID=3037259 RepID=UPI00286EB599|nr:DUF3168 domain-containing protein [Pseudovibrio sp. M1P-2-3]
MSASYDWELQKELYVYLTSLALPDVKKIADYKLQAPGPEEYPFLEIGETSGLPDNAQGVEGSEETIVLHVFDRDAASPGKRRVKQIISALREALEDHILFVAGLSLCLLNTGSIRVFTDPDGVTVHGVLNLKCFCYK